jgi:hypothetical protein
LHFDSTTGKIRLTSIIVRQFHNDESLQEVSKMKFPDVRGLSSLIRRNKKKAQDPDRVPYDGNPLRFSNNALELKEYGPTATEELSPGSAEDILGIMVNPKPRYMESKDGSVKEVATFCSLDNNVSTLAAEIDELRFQAARLNESQVEDEDSLAELREKLTELRSGIDVREDKINIATRAVVYHDRPTSFPLDTVIAEYVNSASFLLRSFQRDISPFSDRLEEIKHWGNSVYANYLDDYIYHVAGTNDPSADLQGRTLRDLVYWCEADRAIPEPKEVTASLYGKVLTMEEAAWFLFETIERHPYSVESRHPFRFRTYRGNPLKFACPKAPFFEDDYYVINQRGYRIYKWPLQVDPKVLGQILALDVDMLVCADLPATESGRELYASVLLRSSSEMVKNNQLPKLDSITRQLRRFNAVPLTGEDLRHAFQGFMPGSEILDSSVRFKLHSKVSPSEAREFFEVLRKHINAGESTSQGNFFFGFKNGDRNSPVFRDAESECVTMAFVGQQQAGKTETSTKRFVLPRTPHALVIHWSTAHGESWPQLAHRMGGRVLSMELSDVSSKEFPDRDERLKEQTKIMEAAADRARKMVRKLSQHWEDSGKPVGLPLVIKPVIDSVAFVVFASTFLDEFSLAYEAAFIPEGSTASDKVLEPTDELHLDEELPTEADDIKDWIAMAVDDPRLCIIFLDDISNLDEVGMDQELGHLKRDAQQAARESIKKGLYNYRKRRQALIITTQSFDHLRTFYPVDAFASIITIELTSRSGAKVGTLYDPQKATKISEMKVRESNIDFRLDPYLLNYSVAIHDKF